MEVKNGTYLHSWAPHHSILGGNICHYGMHNGQYRKGLQRKEHIISDSQAATKALDFQMNSKLV